MNEVTLQQVAFGHWEVIWRNIDTGQLRIAIFATWEKEIAERFAERKADNTEYLQ